ncbi:hypothetical protein BH24ACI3_BH24ACI3_03890 [soil metagenome]
MKLRWQFGIIAGIFLAIFCLYPQLKLIHNRDGAWNGHYAFNDIDEVAYASYLRALIDGRPRKNDPYTGRDDSPETPQPESLFSIQFAAPYTVAIPARILGIGTPWAMTIAGALAGFFSALAVFWLIGRVSGDSWFAMAAALGVFCFGTLAAGEGAISEVLFGGFSYPYFPGFRRYIPALGFPAFFGFCGCIWKIVEPKRGHPDFAENPSEATVPRLGWVILAALLFAYTVFSYFYVWTTAASFLACVVVVWLAFRPSGWEREFRSLCALAAVCVATLVPYAYLLSQRADAMDNVQLLVYTRMPDLLRLPEYVAAAVIIMLIIGLTLKSFDLKERAVLITVALALVPFVVFNQQIITGRSLQPIHYQVFIGNYVAMLALFFVVGLLFRSRMSDPNRPVKFAWLSVALVAILWGSVECYYTVRILDEQNVHRDKAMPVAQRIEDLVMSDGASPPTVLSYDLGVADDLPTIAPAAVLWSHHQSIFTTLSARQYRERIFSFLYYIGTDSKDLEYIIRTNYAVRSSLFGWGRDSTRLTVKYDPVRREEIAAAVADYERFADSFAFSQASEPEIRFVIVPRQGYADLSNFESWYDLDRGEVIGEHVLYRSTLRREQ